MGLFHKSRLWVVLSAFHGVCFDNRLWGYFDILLLAVVRYDKDKTISAPANKSANFDIRIFQKAYLDCVCAFRRANFATGQTMLPFCLHCSLYYKTAPGFHIVDLGNGCARQSSPAFSGFFQQPAPKQPSLADRESKRVTTGYCFAFLCARTRAVRPGLPAMNQGGLSRFLFIRPFSSCHQSPLTNSSFVMIAIVPLRCTRIAAVRLFGAG